MSTGFKKEVDVGKDTKGKKQPQDLAVTGEDAAAIKGGKTRPGMKRPALKRPGIKKS